MTSAATRFTFLDLILFGSPKIDESVRGPMNLHMLSRFQKYKIPISVVTLINATILLAMFSADSPSALLFPTKELLAISSMKFLE